MDFPHLSSAPITEAIFDIRVKARPDFDISEFAQLKVDLQDFFPVVEERRGGQVTFRLEPSGSGSPQPPDIQDLGLQGYFFKSKDEKLIAQFRVDGFTLNKLKPYSSWDELEPLVQELWNKYNAIAKPLAITRCALRYINHIIINQIDIDFDEYLSVAPQIPASLPQTLNSFLTRVMIVDTDNQLAAHVTQVFEPQPTVQFIAIILDIDAFKNVDMPADDPILWEYFSSLRSFKNKVFFNFLTEKTIGQIK